MGFWSSRFILWISGFSSLGATRLILQALLLIIFLYFFGLPAIEKFERKEVMKVETSRHGKEGIPSPAITISATSQKQLDCFGLNSSFERCIDSHTLNRSELLDSVMLGFMRRKILNLSTEGLYEDFTVLFAGRYFVLNSSLIITPNFREDQIFLQFHRRHLISIFLHDPNFFLFNSNMKSLILRKFETKAEQSQYISFELIEVNELNVPSDPCEVAPGYQFHACLRRSLSRQVCKHIIFCREGLVLTLAIHTTVR